MEARTINYYHGQETVNIPIDKEHLKCSVIKTVNKGKVWEKNISKRIHSDCIKDTCVIDIGANIGIHTVTMLNSIGEGGIVIAFEPQNEINDCLKNTLENIGNNFIISDKLVSNKTDESMFYSDGTGRSRIPIRNHRYTKKWNKTIKQTITLDTFLSELNIDKIISLIKIDVEGHEWEVLEGSQNTINTHKPIIYIEVWDKIGDYNKLVEWCKQNNYNIEKLTKNDYKLTSV